MSTLHMLCGKIAAGKSTLAAELARNEMGTHAFSDTKEQFEQVTRHFVPPSPAEGFSVVIHRPGSG